jgi:hypothetical protein
MLAALAKPSVHLAHGIMVHQKAASRGAIGNVLSAEPSSACRPWRRGSQLCRLRVCCCQLRQAHLSAAPQQRRQRMQRQAPPSSGGCRRRSITQMVMWRWTRWGPVQLAAGPVPMQLCHADANSG